jgi:L-asparaginase II
MTTDNPTLAVVTRGRLVECVHRGAIAIARPNGDLVMALGDVQRPVYPRSAIKAIQALPLIESGAADRFGFGASEIALACASHSGSSAHVTVAEHMLTRAGRSEHDLACGAHVPMGDAESEAFRASRTTASQLHNNCSGKHAGMVCLACHLGEPTEGYTDPRHPIQRRIHKLLEELSGATIGNDQVGVDGCSAPNFALPLAGLAQAFARFGTGEGLPPGRREAAARIARSCWAAPEMVAGQGRLDTRLMSARPGKVFTKTGAEGVYCAFVPELGFGIAIKADDGAKRASETMVSAVLGRLDPDVRSVAPEVTELRNWRGTHVGEIRPSPELLRALDRLHVHG